MYTIWSRFIINNSEKTSLLWTGDLKRWLLKFSTGILLIAGIEMCGLVLDMLQIGLDQSLVFVLFRSLIFSAFVIWIAVNGIMQYYVLFIYTSKPKVAAPKIKNELHEKFEQLSQLMRSEKLYLNPDISLSLLANYLEETEKSTSAIINSGGKNLNGFINSYRVEAFKERVLAGDAETLTLTSIAYDSGFDSKATFNRVFKQQTGLTPSQFVAETKVSNPASLQ